MVSPKPLLVESSVKLGEFSLDVNLRAEPGEVIGLTGGIGSGKSTVLRLIAGRLDAAAGRLCFGDVVWDEPATDPRIGKRPVALMGQRPLMELPEHMTGVEAVADGIKTLDPNHGDPNEVARRILADLGVADSVAERLPLTYSGAEAQRVLLARTVAPSPPIVLLDEPFSAMDKRSGATVRHWLQRRFAGFGGIAIIASTNLDHLAELDARIVDLDEQLIDPK